MRRIFIDKARKMKGIRKIVILMDFSYKITPTNSTKS
jgi:hypothetical protein